MLRSSIIRSICESLRSLAHSNCVNFNQAALGAVLRQENIQNKYPYASFVCTLEYASFYRRFQLFQSLFGSISTYKKHWS